MAKSARSKISNLFVWILLGLLVVGLTGFGIGSIGGAGSQVVSTVGEEEISANSYMQALNNELRVISQRFGQNLTLEQARAFGLDRQVLSRLVATAALDGEAGALGISVGDDAVRDQLLATDAFNGLSGQFDQTAYEFALRQAGLTAADYDEVIRKQSSRDIVQSAVVGGIAPSATFANTLFNFLGEGRNFTWADVPNNNEVEFLPAPTQEQLQTYYNDNPEEFTAPLTRELTYVSLTPEMVLPSIEIDEAELQAAYDDQPERFNRPERRIVERLVFGSTEEASAALSNLTQDESGFEALVQSRGLELDDIDLGEVTLSDLQGAAGEAVFALSQPGFVGPVESALGPALFRVNAILDAQSISFADARDELVTEFAADAARRQIADSITDIDDLLAGGATLEDVNAETPMVLQTVEFTADSASGIAAYDEFRTEASAVAKGDFPEVRELSDGGIFALRLDGEIQPKLLPVEDVSDEVFTGWQRELIRTNLLNRAAKLQEQLTTGGTFETLNLSANTEENIRRDDFVENAPAALLSKVFEAEIGDVFTVEDAKTVSVVRVTGVVPFDVNLPESKLVLDGLQTQFGQQVGQDIYDAYARALQVEAGITVNQPMIEAVHRQFGTSPAQGNQPMQSSDHN